MSRKEFLQLLNYLQSHPKDAALMQQALLSGGEEKSTLQAIQYIHIDSDRQVVWVSASAAGKQIGRSASWIKTHRQLFPHTRYEERGKKGKWWFDESEIQGCYDTFLRLNTTAT